MTRTLLRLNGLPVYQNKQFPTAATALKCPRGNLELEQAADSGIVHNAAFDAAALAYDQSYQNEQSHSTSFRLHLDDVLGLLHRHFSGLSVLEVGCGKGAFVQLMRNQGLTVRGVDPAYEGDDPLIERAFFSAGSRLRSDAIVLRHTLEHVPGPLSFLATIRDANQGGLIYVEVPCLDWILEHRAWFDFFYEHVNYFRLGDFDRLFGKVLASGRLFGGQYLYAIADLATLRDIATIRAAEPVMFPQDLFSDLEELIATSRGKTSVIWGAAAKGVMFAHHAIQRGMQIEFAVDINSAKQGGFLAGTGLEVLSPEAALARLEPGTQVFVMNSNYLDEIVRVGGRHLNYVTVDHHEHV